MPKEDTVRSTTRLDRTRVHHDGVRFGPTGGFSAVGQKTLENSGSEAVRTGHMRSFCRRSMMMTSAPYSSRVLQTRTPICAMSAGTSVLGPTRTSAQPSVVQGVDVRARYARMQHITDDGHRSLVVTDREHIKKALVGMVRRR
jgi:hypothetical protein